MKKLNKKLPDKPGVYLFKRSKQILYIGKATSLRDRVRSYFSGDLMEARGPGIVKMIELATSVDFKTTNSVVEALILEAKLIKKHQPKYNVDKKDDKSFNYVVITKEDFPRTLLVRGKELPDWAEKIKKEFGPFTNGGELRQALKIIRKIFPFRDKCQPGQGKQCFNAQIGLCPGVCSGEISKRDYAKIIHNLILFFEGKQSKVLKNFQAEMRKLAKEQKFEEAAKLRNQIFALEHINDIALLKRESKSKTIRIEAFDIAHMSGKDTVGAMVVVEDGRPKKNAYKKFKIKGVKKDKVDDLANLEEILRRRFAHQEWEMPDLVVVDGNFVQKNRTERILSGLKIKVPVASVVKDEKHKPKKILGQQKIVEDHKNDILLANQEAHRFAIAYHRKRRGKLQK